MLFFFQKEKGVYMKELNLGKEKINKLLLAFALPCVISMLINSVYNIVDQIFIGKGVGTLGNAATNVIFPLVIIFNAISGLIGNGAAANLSLKLGEKKEEEAGKSIGQAITLSFVVSIVVCVLAYIFLPQLIYLFGCTDNVYSYALDYGRIIIIGAPFMIIYSVFSSIIRADGSPKYSMIMLVVGAIINIILDPIFIFTFNLGVKGGAIATVIGQIVSFIIAIAYIKKFKSVKLKKEEFKLDSNVFRILSLGLSSFITQGTILVLFVFMNNVMTKLGAATKFGSDIPLSVYGVVSKINTLYISTVLGISIGAQPIIGFNYGAGNEKRVKETLRKVLTINFIVGIIFNILFFLFPKQIIGIFISDTDPSYSLFIEFAVLMCHTFFAVIAVNAMEMTTSNVIQSLGKVKKATLVTFIRQIILLIPISLLLAYVFNKGIYGVLYAGAISDIICFIITIFIFLSEYRKLDVTKDEDIKEIEEKTSSKYNGKHIVVTISREYASGGRYVGKILADNLGVNFYDQELITLAAKESGLSKKYIEETDEKMTSHYENSNDDRLFIAESNVIKEKAKKESCVIVGRCADYILKDEKDTVKIFLYSDEKSKINRAVKYYGLNKNNALKKINKINKDRAKHYKFYTDRDWYNLDNYDILLNVDKYGVEETAKIIEDYISKK
jgi:putative MATE family efflux protein